MKKRTNTIGDLIAEGVAATTWKGNERIDPYRVLACLHARYPEEGFLNLPTAKEIREYIVERDPSRSFDQLGRGDYHLFYEVRPLSPNEIQPQRSHSHHKTGAGKGVHDAIVQFRHGSAITRLH